MSWSPPVRLIDRTHVEVNGRRMAYFAGCDYFRLSRHPRILGTLRKAAGRWGWNVAASRKTTGNHLLYEQLEDELAAFFEYPKAILAPNGYSTNLAVAQTLRGAFGIALIDDNAHASLRDASECLDCPVIAFRHRSVADLRAKLRTSRGKKVLLLTDGLFPISGTVAPLKAYHDSLPKDAFMLVDDAHGAGLLGLNGRGTVELEPVRKDRTIVTLTLSKSFGLFGGVILAPTAVGQEIVRHSRLLTGSTPFPLPFAAAAKEALRLLRDEPDLRTQLWQNVNLFWEELGSRAGGVRIAASPIVPVYPGNPEDAAAIKRMLSKSSIYPPLIQYGGQASLFRFIISSAHSHRQVLHLARTLGACRDKWETNA